MPDMRPVLFIAGILIITLSLAMLLPAAADFAHDDYDWHAFLTASAVTGFVGFGLVLSCQPERSTGLSLQQAFLLTGLSWILLAGFAALPFLFSNLPITFTDAYFEAMSGLTTTGSTILTGLDSAPVGILLWRAILHWIGGVGIIVMAVSILPYLRVGGMQLFRTESSDLSDKVLPRISQIAGSIVAAYLVLTITCAGLLFFAGMTPFEAICHSMATISTGGFSTSDGSVGHFDNALIEVIIIVFMLGGGITITLYIRVWSGEIFAPWRSSQVRWFLGIIATSTVAIALWQIAVNGVAPLLALRASAFNVVSIVTTTGFASADYGQWGTFPVALMYFLTFLGGCTGSTTGGLKIFRLQVLKLVAVSQLRRSLFPHGVFTPIYDGRPLPEAVGYSVLGFFFLFGTTFAFLSLLLSLTGLDIVTSLSGAATALANVGPGLGDIIGPAGNFAPLPDFAKWVLTIGMLLGRLELVTLLVLLVPGFLRR